MKIILKKHLHKKKLKHQLIQRIKKKNTIIKWLDESIANCLEHKMFIIEHILICKIFNKTKIFSSTSKQEKLSKLKILTHI